MITADDLAPSAGLSNEQKFQFIEQLARKRLNDAKVAAEFYTSETGNYCQPAYTEIDYAIDVSAAAMEFDIFELHFDLPYENDEYAESKYRKFRNEATRVSQRLLFRHRTCSATVALDGRTKQLVSHLLQQIREIVQSADITSDKKDRLFDLIAKLQVEVDRERTPIHAAGEFWLATCTFLAEGIDKLEPAIRLIERIGGALGTAQTKEEAGAKKLPPSAETKRITGPAKSKRNMSNVPHDEDMPF